MADSYQQYFEIDDLSSSMQRSHSVFTSTVPDDISLHNQWESYAPSTTLSPNGQQQYWNTYSSWPNPSLGVEDVPDLTDYSSIASSQSMSRQASSLSTFSSFDPGAFDQNQPQTHILAGMDYTQDQSQDLLQSPITFYPPTMDEYSYLQSPNATYSSFGSFPNQASFIPTDQKTDPWFNDFAIAPEYAPRRHSSPTPNSNASKRPRTGSVSLASSKPKRALPIIKVTTVQDLAGKTKPARAYCTQCSDHPSGFHGQHELERHILRKHSVHKTVWVVKDGVKFGSDLRVKKPLEGCEECSSGKTYMQPYNVAAQ
jgi:hypothetical protein